jgi:hypothetical protein
VSCLVNRLELTLRHSVANTDGNVNIYRFWDFIHSFHGGSCGECRAFYDYEDVRYVLETMSSRLRTNERFLKGSELLQD